MIARTTIIGAMVLVSLSLVLGASSTATLPTTTAANTFGVDSTHSSVVFRIKHSNVSNFYGRFNSVSGSFTLDAEDATKSSINVEIKADSVDTANNGRDNHLKGPDFLNAQQFPTISFKSKTVKKTADDKYEVTGDLTLHGVTKSVTAQVEHTGTAEGRRGQASGIEAILTIKRSEFGMNYMIDGGLGDEIRLTVSLEGRAGGSRGRRGG